MNIYRRKQPFNLLIINYGFYSSNGSRRADLYFVCAKNDERYAINGLV